MAARTVLSALAVTASMAVVTSGCGGTTSSSAPQPAATSSSATTSPSPASTSTPSSSAAETSDASSQQVTVDGLSLMLPEHYSTISADQAVKSQSTSSPEVQQLAQRLGVTPAKVLTLLKQSDLYAVSDASAKPDFLDNINVVMPGASTLPTKAQFASLLSGLGATLSSFRTTTAGGLPTAVAVYGAKTTTGTALTGTALIVLVGGQAVEITVLTGDAGVTRRATDSMLATLTAS